ncbi:lipocalin-like domain-containing protein [Lactiplantibacillus herbarum]|uniref:lipocalin-like domain-containing protein n=1 Tax=Lactiplantibacillus herbarum TaxID=1670446 RepID=UPI00064FD984|nr:lipocalin-like domain-containing protein [Lactiplantibacillus herbarum]
MAKGRIMNQPADFKQLGINPNQIEAWEDGRRDNDQAGHAEIWYFDCSFDDKSTLVLGFRPKSVAQVDQSGDNPNIAINYSNASGKPFYDYRLYDVANTATSKTSANLKWGPNSLIGQNWQSYDVHVEPEADQEVVMDGMHSVQHQTAIDLHFDAQVAPFRPGTGYIAFGDQDDYYYNFICITKLTVRGTITIDGEQKEVTGSAYYNHQWFNISPINAFHHWVWGRQNIGKYNVLIYDMVGADQFGQPQIPLMTIDDNQGKRIFENTSAANTQVEILETYVQPETGKTVPKTIKYTFNQKEIQVEYLISDPKEIKLIDIYGTSPAPAQQQFDKLGLQPTYTRYLAKTQLKIIRDGDCETIDGEMLYEINFAAKTL